MLSSYQWCYSQHDYDIKLSARLASIRELTDFDNSVVVFDEPFNYAMSFSYWTETAEFYERDFTRYKWCLYMARVDSKGKRPDISPEEWRFVKGSPPYLFLRDTAKTDDLKALLKSDHPFIRVYAFGALAKRGEVDLFQIVVENLGDTTSITYYTSDAGEEGYPADLMLSYVLPGSALHKKIL